MSYINALHVFIFAPLLIWLGVLGKTYYNWVNIVLIIMGGLITLYHGYKLFSTSIYNWVSWIHVLLIGPLLFFIGWNNGKVDSKYYKFLVMLGGAALVYHSLRLKKLI